TSTRPSRTSPSRWWRAAASPRAAAIIGPECGGDVAVGVALAVHPAQVIEVAVGQPAVVPGQAEVLGTLADRVGGTAAEEHAQLGPGHGAVMGAEHVVLGGGPASSHRSVLRARIEACPQRASDPVRKLRDNGSSKDPQ